MALNSSLCCLCLKTSDFLLNIFEEESENKSLALIISQHFWFDIKKEETISRNVCVECWSNVENFHLFYKRVYSVHNEFYSRVHDEMKPIIDEKILVQQSVPDTVVLENKSSIKSERLNTEDAAPHNIEQPMYDFENEEPEDVACASDNSGYSTCKLRSKGKMSREKLRKSGKIDPAIQAKIKEENIQIRERFIMECEKCNFHFDTFFEAQIHYRTEHRIHGYLRCCDTKFKSRPTVVEHLHRHLNPEEFKCEQCNKTFVNKRGLAIHKERHLSTQDKPFKCNECPKSYIRRFLLERHLESHKDLPKYICDDCGKEYSNQITLSIHKRNAHDRPLFYICDVCAREFRNKLDFDLHHRNVHDAVPPPKVQCKVCDAWLKTKQSLRQHMVRHKAVKLVHPCVECDKSFPYRWALRNHIRTLHTKKLFDCNLCDKQFKRPVSLREHMATHTGVSLYQCQYCSKTFNSSANMSSHKKKVHKTERETHLKMKAAGLV